MKLIVNRFYWVRVARLNDPSRRVPWEPARFTGKTLEGDHPLTWDFIGQRSEDGHHFLEVVEVGEEIKLETRWPAKRAKKAKAPAKKRARK